MVDAGFIEVPRSKPPDEERKAHQERSGKQDSEPKGVIPASSRECQLDYDAKSTKKNSRSYARTTLPSGVYNLLRYTTLQRGVPKKHQNGSKRASEDKSKDLGQ